MKLYMNKNILLLGIILCSFNVIYSSEVKDFVSSNDGNLDSIIIGQLNNLAESQTNPSSPSHLPSTVGIKSPILEKLRRERTERPNLFISLDSCDKVNLLKNRPGTPGCTKYDKLEAQKILDQVDLEESLHAERNQAHEEIKSFAQKTTRNNDLKTISGIAAGASVGAALTYTITHIDAINRFLGQSPQPESRVFGFDDAIIVGAAFSALPYILSGIGGLYFYHKINKFIHAEDRANFIHLDNSVNRRFHELQKTISKRFLDVENQAAKKEKEIYKIIDRQIKELAQANQKKDSELSTEINKLSIDLAHLKDTVKSSDHNIQSAIEKVDNTMKTIQELQNVSSEMQAKMGAIIPATQKILSCVAKLRHSMSSGSQQRSEVQDSPIADLFSPAATPHTTQQAMNIIDEDSDEEQLGDIEQLSARSQKTFKKKQIKKNDAGGFFSGWGQK